MCMLTVFPLPDLMTPAMVTRLENGAEINDDGHGWAVVTNGHIVSGKSLSKLTAVREFCNAYEHATGPAMFHSRWATHGEKTLANTHPFPVRKLRDTYVAHNGIMPMEALPQKWDVRSDTRVFADDILPIKYRRLDSPKVREHLGAWLKGNKIAILTTNRELRRNLYVFGLELGDWVDGVWFSNSDHEGYSHRWLKTDASDEACIWCKQKTVSAWDICECCGTCQDCMEPEKTCQCFVPANESRAVVLGPKAITAGVRPDESEDIPPAGWAGQLS